VHRYGRFANALAGALTGEFGGDVEVPFINDAGATGNFEVKLENNGSMPHSKKAGGDRCESAGNTQVCE
jgi:hypothetical protein